METFSFRIMFYRSPEDTININAPKWEWIITKDTPSLILCTPNKNDTIQDSKTWIFKSDGWPSQDDAEKAVNKYFDVLALTLVRLRIGADYGNRAPKSFLTNHGLAMFEAKCGQRVLNNIHGLMVFETEPPPRFASAGCNVLLGKPQNQFEKIFSRALSSDRKLTERERLSMELFNSSFFQKTNEAKTLLLVMAIEALLEFPLRPKASLSHVESLIESTNNSTELLSKEKDSLLGSLRWLRYESIRQTGCKLVEVLENRTYLNKGATAFFTYCYDVRSRLTHGKHPFPSQNEIASIVSPLTMFVSDILSGDLRDIELT